MRREKMFSCSHSSRVGHQFASTSVEEVSVFYATMLGFQIRPVWRCDTEHVWKQPWALNFCDTYQITHGAFGARKAPESYIPIRSLLEDTRAVILSVSSTRNSSHGAAFLNWWVLNQKWVSGDVLIGS